ncbi:MAG: ATP-dependent helicase, partial [Bacteroidota bacterium]
ITFVTMADEWHLRKIEGLIGQSLPKVDWPKGVDRPETLHDEKQTMLREIDQQRRKENPEFKGAFHEKRAVKKPSANKRPKRRK